MGGEKETTQAFIEGGYSLNKHTLAFFRRVTTSSLELCSTRERDMLYRGTECGQLIMSVVAVRSVFTDSHPEEKEATLFATGVEMRC